MSNPGNYQREEPAIAQAIDAIELMKRVRALFEEIRSITEAPSEEPSVGTVLRDWEDAGKPPIASERRKE